MEPCCGIFSGPLCFLPDLMTRELLTQTRTQELNPKQSEWQGPCVSVAAELADAPS